MIKKPDIMIEKPDSMIEKPIDQKMLYDYRFLDMYKEDLENIIHNDENKFKGKNIKEVYDNLVFDYKLINQKKNLSDKKIKIEGAFRETALPVDQWHYDDDNNELSFDPYQSLELAVPIVEEILLNKN
jgi:hypothetical protein